MDGNFLGELIVCDPRGPNGFFRILKLVVQCLMFSRIVIGQCKRNIASLNLSSESPLGKVAKVAPPRRVECDLSSILFL